MKDEFGRDYLRRDDGSTLLTTAWACGTVSFICAVIGAFTSSNAALLVASAVGSLWAVFFVTGHVSRAIYFVAGDVEKPRSGAKQTRWRSEEGYRRVDI